MAAKIAIAEALSLAERIALAKISAPKGEIEPGDHAVDFMVRVKGTVRKGEDYQRTPTVSIPTLAALALFVKRMGFQRDVAIEKLMDCMKAALKGESAAEIDEWLGEAAEKVREGLEALPKATVKGVVTTVDMSVEKIDATVDAIAIRQ